MMRSINPGSHGREAVKPQLRRRIGIAASLAAMLVLAPMGAAARLSPAAESCLGCHSMPALAKTLGNGEKLPLHVPPEAFAESVHGMLGCTGCHRDVDPDAHPSMKPYESARAYTLTKADACKACHLDKHEQYQGSIHASQVKAGDEAAPVCSSCHDVHAQRPMADQQALIGELCRGCHGDIFEAYANSMHGKAKAALAEGPAPICTDCHEAHEVTAVASGERMKQTCMGCHEGAELAHREWLPNTALHLEAIACPACHSPMAERAVDLRLYDRNSKELVGETLENPKFAALAREIDTEGDGLDPLELWRLVRAANRQGLDTSVTLRGRLEVPNGPDAHQLALKSEAVRQCDSCHRKDAEPFRKVSISVTAEDGRRIRYAAGKETLTSAVSVDSVSGFYTAGGTRIGLLDGLLALAVLSGIGIPLTHMSIRKWFRRRS